MLWPTLREELALLPGPTQADGQPSWTLHDPIRNQFFRIDWLTFEILRHWWQASASAIAQTVSSSTTLHASPADVDQVMAFLRQHQLVQIAPGTAAALAQRLQAQRQNALTWLLHHYLFFRIPLLRPDTWLGDTLPWVRGLASRTFALATVLALLLGMLQIWRQWEPFKAALLDTLGWQGALAYAVALTFSKILHELGHAYVAKAHGCRVPTMGVAFLVLWPVAYTDTNESWRLRSRSRRLHIAAAGIFTELILAAWATLAWALLPDGALRAAALVLASSTWVATLMINASPFMRFDGYFILSDALDFPNLHERSFAFARWHLRECLFDLGDAAPEPLSARKTRLLIAFAWMTWLYRLALFVGIALLVYTLFFKLLGLLLFAVEIGWFVLLPLWKEAKTWHQRWGDIRQRRRTRWTVLVMGGFVALLGLPWPGTLQATALLRPAEVLPLYAPVAARLTELRHPTSAPVAPGQRLFQLETPELHQRQTSLTARAEDLRWQAATASLSTEASVRQRAPAEQLATAQSALHSLEVEKTRLETLAPYAGTVHWADPDLQKGQWLSRRERLGALVAQHTEWVVETWLDEDAVRRLRVGDSARLLLPGQAFSAIALTVHSIDPDAAQGFSHGELTQAHGGHLPARERQGMWTPSQAVYRVQLQLNSPLPPLLQQHSWRGDLSIRVQGHSPLLHYLRHALSVLIREAAF